MPVYSTGPFDDVAASVSLAQSHSSGFFSRRQRHELLAPEEATQQRLEAQEYDSSSLTDRM